MPTNATYFSYPYGAMNFLAALTIRILIANSCTRWRGIFKGSIMTGDGRIFLKIFPPLSLINNHQMNLTSARSISLDSTFTKMLHAAEYLGMARCGRCCPVSSSALTREATSLQTYIQYLYGWLGAIRIFLQICAGQTSSYRRSVG
jgi:hypothetical protein